MGDTGAGVVTYLPASLVRAVVDHPADGLPWYREIDGTLVMADLSGFTALSERLAQLGDEGAERLTEVINSFFERMLNTASGYGGDTLTFGGDAILLLFDGPEHASRAVAASLAMLKQVDRARAVPVGRGKIKIGMSVGAHSDTFALTAAGLEEERAHLFVLGRGAERTALAEAQAERGELAISSSTRDLLPGGAAFAPTGDYWKVDTLPACAQLQASAARPEISEQRIQQLAPFLPPYVRSETGNDGGRVQHSPEHRRTVIAFVNVLGLGEVIDTEGIGAALEQLQAYSVMLTRLAAKHRGFVVSSDIATQGSKLVVTFGTPVAHEYAPANAARFALDLIDGLRQSGLDLKHKIGLNGGHIFAGEVGPSFRRQYTVMGDDVNLAARLMGAAKPGDALISRKLLDYVGPDLCARELAPITVKGKEKPVAVCVLERDGGADGPVRSWAVTSPAPGRLCGRRAELDVIRDAREQAQGGRGHTILIEGEPGVGKTRLLQEALGEMTGAGTAAAGAAPGVRVTRATCYEHLQAAPFTPWMQVLHAVFEIARDDSAMQRTKLAAAYLQGRLPDLFEIGSLLNPLLDVSLPRNEVVDSLDVQTRRQRLLELITRVLAAASDNGVHAIVIEDIHWMDESSLALAAHLARHIAGMSALLLLTARHTEVPVALAGADVTRIGLAELSEPESLAMVREALDVEDLPGEVGEAVYAKTKGNPLFLEEVIRSLQAPGVLARILSASSVTRAAELAALEIPDRVQGLLMSRIDRLAPDAREVLKAGAVVGRSFDALVIAGIGDSLLRQVAMERAFDELLAAALVVTAEAAEESSVTFRHALVQDVAYESLPFARRRLLHGHVAQYLESAEGLPDHAVLVHHYRHAGDPSKTRLHAVRASESSVAVYAIREAVDYLAVALGTAHGRNPHDAALRSRFEELTGDSLDTLARHSEASACFLRARRRWASPAVRRAAGEALRELAPIDDVPARDSLLCWKIAVSLERGPAAYQRALRWLDKGAATLPRERPGLEARLLVARCATLNRLGRFREAVMPGEQGLALARVDGDEKLQAYALTLLGSAYGDLGLFQQSVDCELEAIALYEASGDLIGQAMSHGNVAYGYTFLGDLRRGLEHEEAALGFFSRVGNLKGVLTQQANVAGVLLEMGEFEAAIDNAQQVIRQRATEGVLAVTGITFVILCDALVRSNRVEEAAQALAEGRVLLESIGAEGLLLDADVAEAELRLAQGRLAEGERVCHETIKRAEAMGGELQAAQALCLLGRVRLAQGDPEAAVPGLEACVALAEKIGSDSERARALAVLAEARASCGEAQEACADDLFEAMRVFRRIGAHYDLERAEALRARLQVRA